MLQRLTEKLHLMLHAADRNEPAQWALLDDVAREEGRVIAPGFSRWRRLDKLLAAQPVTFARLNAHGETGAAGRLLH